MGEELVYHNRDVEEYAAATWTFCYLLVLLYLTDGRLQAGKEVRVTFLEETLDRLEQYFDKLLFLRGKLGLSTELPAFTDSFRFDGFSLINGIFHGDMDKAEEICGKWSAIHWKKAPDEGMALNFEISALCMMWAHGAEKVLNALYDREKVQDGREPLQENTQDAAKGAASKKACPPWENGFKRLFRWLRGGRTKADKERPGKSVQVSLNMDLMKQKTD